VRPRNDCVTERSGVVEGDVERTGDKPHERAEREAGDDERGKTRAIRFGLRWLLAVHFVGACSGGNAASVSNHLRGREP
jgi:hypothetical protein